MRGALSERACRMLAGADTGVAGGVLVLIWLSFFARMQGDYWWSKWNVAGALFYGDRVFVMGPGLASIAGAALLLLIYAAIGVAFSLLGRPRGFAFNLFAGLTLALLWHQLADWLLWPRAHPSAPQFFHPFVMLPANMMFGFALIRFGPRFRRIALAVGDPAWAGQFRPPTAVLADPEPAPPEEIREPEEVRAAEASEPAEESRPEEEVRAAEAGRLAEEIQSAEASEPAEENRPAEEVRAAESGRLVEEIQLAEEVRSAVEVQSAEQVRAVEEVRPAEASEPAEESRPEKGSRASEGSQAAGEIMRRQEDLKTRPPDC